MPPSAPQNLKPLTALRFFAAMWVVLYDDWPGLRLATPRIVAHGYLGVDLFFVLSGFILTHVYLSRFGAGRFRYPDFLWARLARIYPAHLATLVGIGLLSAIAAALGFGGGGGVLVWSSIPAQLTLTQAWGLGPAGGWNHPAWSISAEWFAYLTFPGFAWIAWRLRRRPALAVALAVAGLAAIEIGFGQIAGAPLTRATIAWGALRIVPCFALGAAVWLLWRARPLAGALSTRVVSLALVAAIAIVLALGAPDWISIVLFGALIFALASLAGAGPSVLDAPGLVYLGEISFAVYMAQVPFALVFTRVVHRLPGMADGALPWPVWLVEALGVIPAAMALHHLVERPAREAMRRHGVPFPRLFGGRLAAEAG
jgi:peptidoglycan/LPS O-acetylase OafA/YrhL